MTETRTPPKRTWKTQFTSSAEALSVTWKFGMAILAVSFSPPVQDACRKSLAAAQCGSSQWLVSGALLLSAGCALFASWRYVKARNTPKPSSEFKANARNAVALLAAWFIAQQMGHLIRGFGSTPYDQCVLTVVIVSAIVVDVFTRK